MSKVVIACFELSLLGLLVFGAAALADNDAIKQRKSILKGFGDATRPVASMIKNRQPFDLALVRTALATYATGSKKLPLLFPPDSKTGDKTEARAIIWDEKPKFDGEFDALNKDAAKALADIADDASFRAMVPKVLGDCKECHDTYREKE